MPTTQVKPTALRDPLRFTVHEYHAMAQAGILAEDEYVELIEGFILPLSPIGSRHAACVDRLNRLFFLHVGDAAIVRVQNPIRLDGHSEPQPDLALLTPKDVYADRHPLPDEVLLVVEVADTSLDFDRQVKLPLYARAGLREVWLVNLEAEEVVVYRRPGPEGYAEVTTHPRGAAVRVAALPDAAPFLVDAILGP